VKEVRWDLKWWNVRAGIRCQVKFQFRGSTGSVSHVRNGRFLSAFMGFSSIDGAVIAG
jgi:hypothetical protein